MKKFKLLEEEVLCPTSWDDVTLKMQIEASDLPSGSTFVDTIAIYCSISKELVRKAPLTEIKKIGWELKFLSQPIEEKAIIAFEYKGEVYNVYQSILKAKTEDWVAINTALDANKDNLWKAMPTIIAVLTNESESIFDMDERAKYFNEVPVSIAKNLSDFFLLNEKASIALTNLSLQPKEIIQQRLNEVENTLLKQGGGELYIKQLIGELRTYIESL